MAAAGPLIAMMRDEQEMPATPGRETPGPAAVAEVRQYVGIEWDDDACCSGVACGCVIRLAEQAQLAGDDAASSQVGSPRPALRGAGQ